MCKYSCLPLKGVENQIDVNYTFSGQRFLYTNTTIKYLQPGIKYYYSSVQFIYTKSHQ